MKKVLIAIAAMAAMTGAMAQHHGDRHHDRHGRWDRQVHIDDRVERRVFWDDGRKILVTTTYRCVEQHRGRCDRWVRVSRDRQVLRHRDY